VLQEFEHSESMFTHTLDFQWAVLRQSPTKAAPYLVCSRYAQGIHNTKAMTHSQSRPRIASKLANRCMGVIATPKLAFSVLGRP
jgi:hypothetical protein